MEDFPAWQQGVREEYSALRGLKYADVAIVGGGLTGAACAQMLSRRGVKVALLEAHRLGMGSSWACTGKVTSQVTGVYETIIKAMGVQAAAAYARLLREAVTGVRQLVEELRLRCSMREETVYTFAETTDDLPALEKLVEAEGRIGLPVSLSRDAGGCPFPVELSAALHRQLTLSPLPYLLGLVRAAVQQGCTVYENTPVVEIDGGRLRTPGGLLEAERIVLATGTPMGCTSLPRLAQVQQRACQAVALRSPVPLLGSHLSVQADEMTLRPIHGGALLAWDMGRVGTKERHGREIILARTLKALLPDMQVTERIYSQDVWSGDGLPLIGPIHPRNDRLMMATGYSGWGVANAWLAGQVITGLVTGHPLPETGLFRPDRHYAGHARVLLREGVNIAGGYLSGLTRMSSPTCPHMGGKLRYNDTTGLWECPCHGSVLDVLGQPRVSPAASNAQVSARQRYH